VIKVQGMSSLGWDTLYVKDIYLCVMPKPTSAQVSSDLSEGSYSTDTNWHDVASIDITPSGTKDVLIFGSLSLKGANATNEVRARLYDDTGSKELGPFHIKSEDWYSGAWAYKIANVSAQRTIKVQVSTTNVGTAVYHKDAFVFAFVTDDLGDFVDAYSASGNTTSGSLVTFVTKTWTPAAAENHVILYHATFYNIGSAWYHGVEIEARHDGVNHSLDDPLLPRLPPSNYEVHVPALISYGASLPTSSRTDDYQYLRSTGGTAYYLDGAVMAWREVAAGQIYERSVTFGCTGGISLASQGEFYRAISLGTQAGYQAASQGEFFNAIQFAAQAGYTSTAGMLLLDAVTFGAQLGYSLGSLVHKEGSINLGVSMDQQLASQIIAQSQITFGTQMQLTLAAQGIFESAIILALNAGMLQEGTIKEVFEESIGFALNAAISFAAKMLWEEVTKPSEIFKESDELAGGIWHEGSKPSEQFQESDESPGNGWSETSKPSADWKEKKN